jgi:hypothetical protein
MATAKGFTPARTRSGQNVGLMEEFSTSNGYATALFRGDPIAVSTNGFAKRAGNTQTVVGVFEGSRYIDPTTQKMTFTPFMPASTSTAAGTLIDGVYDTPRINVQTAETATWFITADATVTQGLVGRCFEVSFGTGSTFTGNSGAVLRVASATTSAVPTSSMVRLISLVNGVDNPRYSSTGGGAQNITDATPTVEVMFLRTRYGNAF